MSQTTMEAAGKSMAKKKQVVINMAKWEAASAYAKQRKIRFRVVSEEQFSTTANVSKYDNDKKIRRYS